jgi:hypothetical protein
MSRRSLVLLGLIGSSALLASLALRPRPQSLSATRIASAAEPPGEEVAGSPRSEPASSSSREAVGEPEAAPTAARPALGSEPALLAALARVGQAFDAGSLAELEEALEALLLDPTAIDRLIDLWQRQALRPHPAANLGGLIALEAALVLYGRADGTDRLEARAFVQRVLMALPGIDEPELSAVVERLAEARFGEEPILDARFLRDVLDLRMAWPELRAALAPLLAHLGRGMEGGGASEAFYAVLANEKEDPLAVSLALAALLEDGSEGFQALAEHLFAESRDPLLRDAVLRALVGSLPVERAAEAFARLAGGSNHAEAFTLGAREGGSEALHAAYQAALEAGVDNARAREMLVVGMGGAPGTVLQDIARHDPDGGVRGQAWVMLAAHHPLDGAALAELASAARAGEGRLGVASHWAAMAAAGALRQGTASARAAARELLLEIALDPGALDWVRTHCALALEQATPGSLPPELQDWLERR